MSNEHEVLDVDIRELDRKGSGRGTVWKENEFGDKRKLKLTVPMTLPGETIRVTVERPDKRRWWTKPQEVIKAHEERTQPACPHFNLCGGCAWQHWDYKGQVAYKTEEVRKMVEAQGFDPALVQDAIGAESEWHYRNKMEFTFSKEGDMGLHEQGNFRKIISIETCLIAGKEMVSAALTVAKWAKEHELSGYNKDTHEGLLRHLLVRQSFATGEVMLGVVATADPDGELSPLVEELKERIAADHPAVKSFLWLTNTDWADRVQAEQLTVLAGRDFIHEEMAGYKFRLWHDTFFQTNPVQAEKLVELALEMADAKPTERMIDLFCGVGTFSLPFADKVKALAGIEIVPTSIESAKRNATENGLTNTEFLAQDARTGIDKVLESFGRPELLLLDPPRSGAGGKVMRRIGRAQPERIVYVSCNPETFATDITELVPFGYELKRVQPVDLFPHTVHVELVSVLEKIKEA
ncbi:23S rRNA (uracil(1939)-C(5))-methyltransferase RlmD [Paenalkalicoccus suaedae]|uniref:23S rRNA (Uracil(1939)-C(5))-methyltransferase RlmD n=1 Tax=Paenalkalicoccus suaedae TaxID=2592382 RepID=A0A859FAG5_9BACI|nr:23S rRNA (uracil(1939)-C(5))-methyltransferase RlmD [Paenalkalicoccus suaedae]QKS69788.1 23S rRNA (uracil(1939)-C(5))-methyltransferase RlmD [Paenalkalicoccus suaedae]